MIAFLTPAHAARLRDRLAVLRAQYVHLVARAERCEFHEARMNAFGMLSFIERRIERCEEAIEDESAETFESLADLCASELYELSDYLR